MSRLGRRTRRGSFRHRGLAGIGLLPILLLLAVLTPLVLSAPPAAAQLPLTIEMRDALAFEPGSLSAEPGENITLRLVNGGVLPHTFTLFAEANAQVPVDDNAPLQDFYGRSATLVDIPLEGGEEATVTFTVPTEEGVYTFVCVISGHSAGGMHGLMFVGIAPGDGDFGGIGIVQGLLIFTLIGVGVFAVMYHVRSSRP
ncbi:MAG: plastocyanin/azurin family copper-binding protein [Thermoplasmata archaeon]